MKTSFGNILKYFIQGLIITVPLATTIYLVWTVFTMVDGLLDINTPGLGFIYIFLFVTLVGYLGRIFGTDRLKTSFENWLKKAPLINVIYTSVKDVMNAFVGDKKSFDKPVCVRLSEDSEMRRLGFITNENLKHLGKNNDLITVYLPHSYNISGNMFLVPERYVEPIDVLSSDLMKYTMSGGVTSFSETPEKNTIN